MFSHLLGVPPVEQRHYVRRRGDGWKWGSIGVDSTGGCDGSRYVGREWGRVPCHATGPLTVPRRCGCERRTWAGPTGEVRPNKGTDRSYERPVTVVGARVDTRHRDTLQFSRVTEDKILSTR